MSSFTGDYIDGNAAAGLLSQVFAVDVTAAEGTCAFCGAKKHFGEARLYTQAPGFVARCVVCGHVVLRIARAGTRTLLDMRGLANLCIHDTE